MNLFKRLARLARDTRGNALALGAATMPLIIGGAGLALDSVQLSLAKRQLQRSADTAALAGAHALVQNRDAEESALRALDLDGSVATTVAPVIENAPTTGAWAGNPRAVRVVLAAERPMQFLSYFVATPPTVTVQATAAVVIEGQYCMISLEDGNAPGVTFSGNTTVDIGCGVSSNSRAPAAVSASGSASVRATPIMGVGGVPSSPAYVQPTTLIPFAPPQPNPFADLPLPAPTNCQPRVNTHPSHYNPPLTPGCYRGMDLKGTVTLSPGVYFIDGSSFDVGANATITGDNVTIILTSNNAASNPSSVAQVSIHANATMNLTSSTSGPYKGVLFYEDPRAPLGRVSHINGTSTSLFEGAIYFPRSYLTFNGNSGLRTECMQLVARRLTFSGNSRVQNVCPTSGGGQAFDGAQVRLVA